MTNSGGFNSGTEGCLTCLNIHTCRFVKTGDMKHYCLEDGELKGYQADVELINRIKLKNEEAVRAARRAKIETRGDA